MPAELLSGQKTVTACPKIGPQHKLNKDPRDKDHCHHNPPPGHMFGNHKVSLDANSGRLVVQKLLKTMGNDFEGHCAAAFNGDLDLLVEIIEASSVFPARVSQFR